MEFSIIGGMKINDFEVLKLLAFLLESCHGLSKV